MDSTDQFSLAKVIRTKNTRPQLPPPPVLSEGDTIPEEDEGKTLKDLGVLGWDVFLVRFKDPETGMFNMGIFHSVGLSLMMTPQVNFCQPPSRRHPSTTMIRKGTAMLICARKVARRWEAVEIGRARRENGSRRASCQRVCCVLVFCVLRMIAPIDE